MLHRFPGPIRRLIQPYMTDAGKQAARNLFVLAFCNILGQGCAFAVLLILTNGLNPEVYGTIGFALAAQMYLQMIGHFGGSTVTLRFVAAEQVSFSTVVSSYVVMTLITSGISTCAAISLIWLQISNPEEQFGLMLLAFATIPGSLNFSGFYDAKHRQDITAWIQIFVESASLLAFVCLWYAGTLSIASTCSVFGLKWFVVSGLQAWYLSNITSGLEWKPSLAVVRQYLASGGHIMLGAITVMLPMAGGILLIRATCHREDVAIYAVASQLASAEHGLATLFIRVVASHICGTYGLNRSFMIKLGISSIGFCLTLSLLFGIASWLIIGHLLPTDYQRSLPILWLLLVSNIFLQLAMVGHFYLVRLHAEKRIFHIYFATSSMFLVGGYYISQLYGIFAIALASIIANGIACLVIFVLVAALVRFNLNHNNNMLYQPH